MEVLTHVGSVILVAILAYFLGKSKAAETTAEGTVKDIEDVRKLKADIKNRISKLSDADRAKLLQSYKR